MCKPSAATSGKFPWAGLTITAWTLSVLLAVSSLAQSHPRPSRAAGADSYKISVNVGLVVLPVSVTNRSGEFVPNLHAQDFRVYEAGRAQEITVFQPEDVPVTVGLVIDNSGSMAARHPQVVAASLAFARSSNPLDQMFVVTFNQRVSFGLPSSLPFTSNLQQLRVALSRNPASGNTALYDGIAAALRHLKAGTRERKVLIVVSDGGDNFSRLKFGDVLKMAESSNAVIYTIGIFDKNYSDQNPGVLRRLSKVTGGRAYFPEATSEVVDDCEQIGRDIRQQYTIGYIPDKRTPPGKYLPIRVTAKAAGVGKLYVRTRTGYLIPAEMQNGSSLVQSALSP